MFMTKCIKSFTLRVSQGTSQVKVLATKPPNLSLIPGTHKVKEKTDSHRPTLLFYTAAINKDFLSQVSWKVRTDTWGCPDFHMDTGHWYIHAQSHIGSRCLCTCTFQITCRIFSIKQNKTSFKNILSYNSLFVWVCIVCMCDHTCTVVYPCVTCESQSSPSTT